MLGGFHLGDRFAQFCRNRIPTRIERSVRIRFGERRIVPNCACTLTAKFRPDLLGVRRDPKDRGRCTARYAYGFQFYAAEPIPDFTLRGARWCSDIRKSAVDIGIVLGAAREYDHLCAGGDAFEDAVKAGPPPRIRINEWVI